MKNLTVIKPISALIILLILSACSEDFLDLHPLDQEAPT